MPDYRAAIIENGRETQVRVGSLDDILRWVEGMKAALDACTVSINKITEDKEQ